MTDDWSLARLLGRPDDAHDDELSALESRIIAILEPHLERAFVAGWEAALAS